MNLNRKIGHRVNSVQSLSSDYYHNALKAVRPKGGLPPQNWWGSRRCWDGRVAATVSSPSGSPPAAQRWGPPCWCASPLWIAGGVCTWLSRWWLSLRTLHLDVCVCVETSNKREEDIIQTISLQSTPTLCACCEDSLSTKDKSPYFEVRIQSNKQGMRMAKESSCAVNRTSKVAHL